MRQPEKKRRTVGIRGQLMWFLCFICLFLLVLFWIVPYIYDLFESIQHLFSL